MKNITALQFYNHHQPWIHFSKCFYTALKQKLLLTDQQKVFQHLNLAPTFLGQIPKVESHVKIVMEKSAPE